MYNTESITNIDNDIKKPTEVNSKDKIEIWHKIHEHAQNLITFADQKANFIITLNLWLLAGNFALLSSNYSEIGRLITANTKESWIILSVYAIYIVLVLLFQWLSFNKAISVVTPKTVNESKKSSVFFYGEIARQNSEDFRLKYIWKSESEFLDELIYQIYDKALICKSKFEMVDSSVLWLKINLFLTILHPIINLFINK